MATYRELHGKAVKTVTTNPSDDAVEGQIWFNSTDNTFKSVVALQAWSSASSLLTARSDLGGFGVRDSSVIYGGSTNATEEYNGTGFSASGNLNTGRPNCQDNGWGVETAAVVASGYDGSGNTVNVEEYNGSSFSEVNNVSTARRQHASIGLVQTAGAICGGYTSTNVNSTEEYDGTNWTSGGNLTTTRRGFAGSGTLTAGIVFSGYTTTVVANTEEYDGTSWTAATATNTARNNGIGASNAPQSTALLFGGNTGSDSALTEQYNGTSWTEVADMATARDSLAGSGIGTAALAAGGAPPPGNVALAEEFNQSATAITAAAWSSGGALNQARRIQGNAGGKDAGLSFGGYSEPGAYQFLNVSEEYNGTSWTEGNNLNLARYGLRGLGTQTAAVAVGGQKSGTPTAITNCENYDGTSWTNTGAMNVAREEAGVFGIQTAGVACGGFNGAPLTETNATENFDGSSWTASGTLNSVSYAAMAAGTQTAGVRAGGYLNPTSTYQSFTEEYNGSSWTSVNSMPEGRGSAAPSKNGTQTAWQFSGGRNPGGIVSNTMAYDGTNWATGASISTARTEFDGGGTTSGSGAHLICGGQPGSSSAGVTTTEEFTAETTALNVKTLTQS